MAIPAALTEEGGDKILSPIYDAAGSNAFAALSSRKSRTLNGTVVGELDVYTTSGSLENGNMQLTGSSAISLSATTVPCQGALVKARSGNAATIYVGKYDVTADNTNATGGYPLEPGESVGVPCRNITEVYIRGTSGDGVAWLASAD